jgi:hypothetical protein
MQISMDVSHFLMRHAVRVDAVFLSEMRRGFENIWIPITFNIPSQTSSV